MTLGAFLRTGDDRELKTLSVGSDPDGGYVTYPAIARSMIQKLWDQSAVARLARTETITSGDAWEEPLDLDEADASWVGEHAARTATDTPQLGKLRVPVHEIYANQPVTQRLLDDAGIDVGAWVTDKIADKFARSEGTAFISGNGVGRPRGFLDHPTALTADASRASGTLQYVKTGAAADFSTSNPADKLVDLCYALRGPYRAGPGVAWLMNSATAASVRKFKNGTGDYLWQDSLSVGTPPSLLGFPVAIDESMPSVGAGNYPIAFGNWLRGYLIVQKAGLKLLVDPYTAKPYVHFYGYRRVGGDVADSDAIKLLRCEA